MTMICALLFHLFLVCSSQISDAVELHVSALHGSDGLGDGSVKTPFASLERAKMSVRELRGKRSPPQDVNVVIHEGTYPPFALEPGLDSGTQGTSVTYSGAPGETPPVISGGKIIPNSAFTAVGSGPLVRADLLEHGVALSDLGKMLNGGSIGDCQHEKTDLIFNSERMTLARWPNIMENGTWQFANIDIQGSAAVGVNTILQPETKRMSSWAEEIDPWLHGYWTFDWTDSYVGISNISLANGIATLSLSPSTQINTNARFYGVNLLCELDMPGEYFINQKNGTMYFYPPVPLKQWTADMVSLTVSDVALNISHAQHVSFKHMAVLDAKGVGVLATGVKGITIDNLTIANHGQNGIVIDGFNYTLINSVVHHTGCVGMQASGGDALTLTPGSNVISGNQVHHHALWKRTYMAGILWGGVNNTYSKNVVSDGPHNCFLGGGNEIPAVGCLHEDNIIKNCAYEASDTGAWYSCGQKGAWTDRGNIARRNHFSHIRCHIPGRSVEGCGGGVQAVYLDDQMSAWVWANNTFDDCDTALFIGGGRSNILVGNHISNSNLAVHFDNRGMNWEASACNANGTYSKEIQTVLNGPAAKEYAQRWPELVKIAAADHLCVPVYNQIVNNTYSKVGKFMDANETDVAAWLSVISGNFEKPSDVSESEAVGIII